MVNSSRSPRAYVRWVLAAVPLLAGAVIVGLVLALGHGASHSAVAADMTPMPKPSCPVEDPQPFPEEGCDQYDADISYDANDIPELGDQTCSGTGDISVQRGAVYQAEGQDRFDLDVFHGWLMSTCTPAETQQTMIVGVDSQGLCMEAQETAGAFDCYFMLYVDVKTPNLGSFSLQLPMHCDDVVGGSEEFDCVGESIELPEGGSVEGVSLALTSAAEPTPTPPPSPTSPPPPPPTPIGGVGMFSDVGDSSGGNVGVWAGVAAAMAATVVTLGGAAWYARRRQVQ